ncbi:hypothetical protein [Vibrio sp. VPAP30]|uniref:Uncharacterized protein n=2 Tax=Vibrio bivalvicida TaxID=1276888 RepID=A0A177Y047_9VIBR|nr:hypothetical protein [Vibrio sp. VPAP30]KLN67197.1 hypothetical protein ZX61_00145 [Vibrio sp. VPAP30]OAJ94201.1 hypothetical protein APB76_10905 [Vibrio bivalvicida]
MKKTAVAVSVMASLLVGCGGGSGGGSAPDAKGNEGKGNEAKVVYPQGIYIATMGNGDSADLKRVVGKPEYMGIAFGVHQGSEQDFRSSMVGVDASGHTRLVSSMGEYDSSTVPQYIAINVSDEGFIGNMKDSFGNWFWGNWRFDLPAAQKAQIDAMTVNDYSFNTIGTGFKLVSNDFNVVDLDILYQPIEAKSITSLIDTLPNSEWSHIGEYSSDKTYNSYKFTRKASGELEVTAAISDGGTEHCQTKTAILDTVYNNQVMYFESELVDANACEAYLNLQPSNKFKPYNGTHQIIIGFVEGNGNDQMAVYHGADYLEDTATGVIEAHRSIGGAGLFIRN